QGGQVAAPFFGLGGGQGECFLQTFHQARELGDGLLACVISQRRRRHPRRPPPLNGRAHGVPLLRRPFAAVHQLPVVFVRFLGAASRRHDRVGRARRLRLPIQALAIHVLAAQLPDEVLVPQGRKIN